MPRHPIARAAAWLAAVALTACAPDPATVLEPAPPADALAPSLDFGPSVPTWTISNIPLLADTYSGRPQDISDDGVVVGYGLGSSNKSHAFYWTSAGGTQPLPIGPYAVGSWAMAISDNGRYIVGFVTDSGSFDVPVRWERLRGGGFEFQELRTCMAGSAEAYGVTNAGVVIGHRMAAMAAAVKWTSVASCPTPIVVGGTTMWIAHAINDGGAVVGVAPPPQLRGFATSPIAFLNPLPGDTDSRATSINEWGEVVGLSSSGTSSRATYYNLATGSTFALGTAAPHPDAIGYPRISDRGRTIWQNAPWSGRTTRGTEIRSLMMAPTGVNACGDIVGATVGELGQLYKKTVCDP